MDRWPDFVREEREGDSTAIVNPRERVNRTGWEEVVFDVEDDHSSDFSTAAIAP